MIRLSSGISPLIAETTIFPSKEQFARPNTVFKKALGIAKMIISDMAINLSRSSVKVIRDKSKSTAQRYRGLCFSSLKASIVSIFRINQLICSLVSVNILAIAVAQLPPPTTAILGFSGISMKWYFKNEIAAYNSLSRSRYCKPQYTKFLKLLQPILHIRINIRP